MVELCDILGIKERSVRDLKKGLCDNGYRIESKKETSFGAKMYWIEQIDPLVDTPTVIKQYKNDIEYGKDLLVGVTEVSRVLSSKWVQEEFTKTFEDETVGVVFLADFHLGHTVNNYAGIVKLFEQIRDTDGLYVVTVGDMLDNSVNAYAPTGATNIIDKDGQLAMLSYLLDIIRGKILVMYEGNHEWRSFLSDHFRITEYLAKECGAEYGQLGANFTLFMNETPIRFYCRHKMRGSSQHNPLYGNVRTILFDHPVKAGNADVIVRAHTHVNAVGRWPIAGKERHMLVCGTSVQYDDYADRVNYEPQESAMPMIIIKKDGTLRSINRFGDGIRDLKAFRKSDAEESRK